MFSNRCNIDIILIFLLHHTLDLIIIFVPRWEKKNTFILPFVLRQREDLYCCLGAMIWIDMPLKIHAISFGWMHQYLTLPGVEVATECQNAGAIKSSHTHVSWWTILVQVSFLKALWSLCQHQPDRLPLLHLTKFQPVPRRRMSKWLMACVKFPSLCCPSQAAVDGSDNYSNLDSVRNVTTRILAVSHSRARICTLGPELMTELWKHWVPI